MPAPMKVFTEELVRPLQWVEEVRRSRPQHPGWNGRWPSTVTQFVVGAVGESDLELLSTADYLYDRLRLRRAYFSAFSRPISSLTSLLWPRSASTCPDTVRPAHPSLQAKFDFLLRKRGQAQRLPPLSTAQIVLPTARARRRTS